MAELAGYSGLGLEQTVKLAFVHGLPDQLSVALQREPKLLSQSMSSILDHARILTSRSVTDIALTTTVAKYQKIQCYRCGGPHLIKFCKAEKPKIVCFKCNEPGHISRNCSQGNE